MTRLPWSLVPTPVVRRCRFGEGERHIGTMTEKALGVFIGGSGGAESWPPPSSTWSAGPLATAVQQAGAREIERLKSDLGKGLEKSVRRPLPPWRGSRPS